ncbi:MAG: carbon storage regulator CsrA [Peptococcaceae bacterium]
MLVISRRPGEKIFLGQEIQITILEIKEGNVRLGIEAPPEVKILRGELYQAVREENIRAQQDLTPETKQDLVNLWKEKRGKVKK